MTEIALCHDDTPEPVWLGQLRTACVTASIAEVARSLAVAGDGAYPSRALVSQVLAGRYEGNIDRLQALVEGVLMTVSVDCPVIGDLPRQRCLEHQSRRGAFAVTNPSRIQLYKVCPTCVHRLEKSA